MANSAVAVFIANNGQGPELWRTDGTAGGTFALTTVDPGPLTYLDGIAYFLAPDGNGAFGPQYQLWRSDGTAAGTYVLGLSNGSINSPPDITQLGGKIYYIGSDATHREGLFETDGVHQGVFIASLASNSNPLSASFVGAVGADLLLEVGNALWVSDGTSAGTHLLSDGEAGSSLSNLSTPVVLNGKAYFTADDGVHGTQLWETDGTTTTSVTAPAFGNFGSFIMELGGELIFATSSNTGMSLVSWDGVSASATTLYSSIGISNLQVVNGQAFFTAFAPGNGPEGLFVSDGTAVGTHEIASGLYATYAELGGAFLLNDDQNVYLTAGLPSGTTLVASGSNNLTTFVQVGSRVFFVADNNTQLWVSDGTVAGTHMVLGGLSSPSNLAAVGGALIFSTSTDGSNTEPWISDGTAAGTHAITSIHPENPGSLTIADMGSFDGGLVFLGSTATTGNSIWVSNGTAGGTGVLVTPQPPIDFFLPGPFVAVGNQLFFTADTANGNDLWVASSATPGSTPGPVMNSIFDFGNAPTFMTPFDGKLFFYEASVGPDGFQRFGGPGLFVTDGTDAGTSLVSGATVLAQPIVFDNELVFFGSTAANGVGLFATNGLPGGGSFIATLPSAVTASSFTISGSELFFVAGDASTGAELWVTDGTTPGTHLVEDIAPGAAGSNPTQLTAFDGGVVFDANDQTHGNQVWFSNGTTAGTFSLAINQTLNATASLQTSPAVQFDGKAFFVANDGSHGDQLWSSDGTTAGTGVVTELSLTATLLQASYLTVLGSKLFFVDGAVPWISDGTAAGTAELQIGGGVTVDFSSQAPVLFDGRLFFEGDIAGVGNPALFVTDGTSAGSSELGLADIISQIPGFAVGGNDLIYFSSDGLGDFGLFSYNALTNVKTFLAAAPSNVAFAINVGGQIEIGTPPTFGSQAIWVTDGTAGGTFQLVQSTQDTFTDYTSLGGQLYFLSFGPTGGLWVSNGTVAGTHVASSLAIENDTLTPIGTNLFFIATQSNVTAAYIYNTTSQTAAVMSAPAVKSVPFDVTPVGTGAFFVADDATSQGELWHTTSTGQVVELTSAANGDVAPVNAPNNPQFAVSGGNLFFSADDTVHGQSLFISNGSTTTFLASVNNPSDFSVVGSLLYFEGTDATNGTELWVSNGTAAGTHRVTDTEAANGANGSDFVVSGAKMFFSATDTVHGQELWMFNGQPGGAVMVADINPGAASSNPTDLTALGANVYFIASNASGSELWRSDGTAGGTVAITTASNGANPQDLTLDGSELFFFGSDSAHGSGLFVSDGTAGGTSFLGAFSAAADFTVQGGHFYFLGTNAAAGTELWTSDGTVAGTVMLSSTGTDPGSSPGNIVALAAPPHEDFLADGQSDFLIENTAGAVVVAEVSNGQTAYATVSGLGPVWSFRADGDFLGDDKSDFLIENTVGQVVVGEVVGGQAAYTAVSGLGPQWTFVGAGDYLGDGKDQFLIQNISGTVVVGEVVGGQVAYTAVAALGSGWTFQGSGDFLGDGKSDFLIQNTSGTLFVGEVVGGQVAFTAFANLGPQWTFVGAGDFLGDGKDQFLIQDGAGDLFAGEVAGGQASYTELASLGSGWTFVGTGDYLHEGHDQFLIENASGAVYIADWQNSQVHYALATGLGPEWTFH